MAFNIQYAPVTVMKEMEGLAGTEIRELPLAEGKVTGYQIRMPIFFEWNEYLAPKAL